MKNLDKSRWEKIQKDEVEYHLRKDKSRILEINTVYWKSVLERIEAHVTINDHTRILDVGCGCCGITLAMDRGSRFGIDPLMDDYLKQFEFLENSSVKWLTGTAEEYEFSEPFDIIFSINSLDHMYNPTKVAKRLDSILKNNGHIIISLNCHNTDFFRNYYRMFYRRIDKYHPYHFNKKDLLNLFENYDVVKIEDIDYLDLRQRNTYREKVLKKKKMGWKLYLKYLCNPFKYPIAFTKIFLNRHIHRKKNRTEINLFNVSVYSEKEIGFQEIIYEITL